MQQQHPTTCIFSLTCWGSCNRVRVHIASLDNIWRCTTHCYNANVVRLSRYENFPSELIHCTTIHCSICNVIQCYFISGDHCVDRRSPFYLDVIVSKVTLTWYYRTRFWWNCNRLINACLYVKIKFNIL